MRRPDVKAGARIPAPTRANVKRRALELGATCEESDDSFDVLAPDGMIWSDGSAAVTLSGIFLPDEPRSEAYRDLLERMTYGLEPCTHPGGCDCPEETANA